MSEITRLRPEGLVHSPAFTHVAVVPPGATTIHVGGQNAVDAQGVVVGGEDIAAQTRRVMENPRCALAAAGAGVHDLVSVSILILDTADLAAAYPSAAAGLEGAAPLVQVARVAGLSVPGALLEVSAVAALVAAPTGASDPE